MMPWITVLVLVGVPLWVFRHDIVARFKGMDYIEHLDDRIRRLERDITFSRVRGSPEWCRHRMQALALGWLFIAIGLGAGWKAGHMSATFAVATFLGSGLVAVVPEVVRVTRARRGFQGGARIIEPVRRFQWKR